MSVGRLVHSRSVLCLRLAFPFQDDFCRNPGWSRLPAGMQRVWSTKCRCGMFHGVLHFAVSFSYSFQPYSRPFAHRKLSRLTDKYRFDQGLLQVSQVDAGPLYI